MVRQALNFTANIVQFLKSADHYALNGKQISNFVWRVAEVILEILTDQV